MSLHHHMPPRIRRADHEVRARERQRQAVSAFLTQRLRTAHQTQTYMRDLRVWTRQEKASASETCVLSADLVLPADVETVAGVTHVMVKLSLNDPHVNSLAVERGIYREITHNLSRHMHTPHVVGYLAHYICPWRVLEFADHLARQKVADALQFDADTFDGNIYLLLTQRSAGRSLHSWMTDTDAQARTFQSSEREQFHILWQILYTLHVFDQVGLRHNDLHLGNIMVENWAVKRDDVAVAAHSSSSSSSSYGEDSESSTRRLFNRGRASMSSAAASRTTQAFQQQPDGTYRFTYNLNQSSDGDDATIEFDSRYCVRLFDFDRASIYHAKVPRNSKLDSRWVCSTYNMCATPHRYYDAFGLLSSLNGAYLASGSRMVSSASITTWISDQLGENILEAGMSYAPSLQNSLRKDVEAMVAESGSHLPTPLQCLRSLLDHGHTHFRRKRVSHQGHAFLPPSKEDIAWLTHSSLDEDETQQKQHRSHQLLTLEQLELAQELAEHFYPDLAQLSDHTALAADIMTRLNAMTFHKAEYRELVSLWSGELTKVEYNWRVAAIHVYNAYMDTKRPSVSIWNASVMLACILVTCPMLRAYPPAFLDSMCAMLPMTAAILTDVRRALRGQSPVAMPLLCGVTNSSI